MRMLVSAVLFGLVCAAGSAYPDEGKTPEKYSPAIIYPGPFTPEHLFYRNPSSTVWLPWRAVDFTKKVTCSDAVKRLKRHGVWKGHLNRDGSCGPAAEPSQWAVGNWLNYVESSKPVKHE